MTRSKLFRELRNTLLRPATTGQGRKRWTMRWKPALQAFDIAFDGRLSVGRR